MGTCLDQQFMNPLAVGFLTLSGHLAFVSRRDAWTPSARREYRIRDGEDLSLTERGRCLDKQVASQGCCEPGSDRHATCVATPLGSRYPCLVCKPLCVGRKVGIRDITRLKTITE